MPRKTKKDALAKQQDAAAPYLFDEKNMAVREDVLGAIQSRRYEHTGARLLENEALALRMVEMLCAGLGVKRISRELQVSPKTIRAARRALETQGKLAPFKQRVAAKMADAIEAGVEHYLEAVEDGYVSPAQIPLGMAIFVDKKALILGEATPTPETTAKEAISVDALNAWVDSLPALKPVTDIQSLLRHPTTEEKPQP